MPIILIETKKNIMENSEQTKLLLNSIDSQIKSEILSNISDHYGITEDEAFEEITDEEAHNILEYITGGLRAKLKAIMLKF